MICRLWTKQEVLPTNLAWLIEAALSMLLYKRDMRRGIARDGEALDDWLGAGRSGAARLPAVAVRAPDGNESRRVLEELAFWLVLNGRFSATQEEVLNTIAQAIPSRSGDASGILRYLEESVGVLDRTPNGEISFLYIAFKEYLAASAAAAAMHLDLLIKNAHLDEWDRVVVLSAVHHSAHSLVRDMKGPTRKPVYRGSGAPLPNPPTALPNEQMAGRVIKLLLQRAENDGDHRRKLSLLAVECFGIADRPAELLSVIDPLLQALVPPLNSSEASALAGAGEFVIPHLAGHASGDEAVVAACVRALQLIGTHAAGTLIDEYRADTRRAVADEIARWDEYLQARGDQLV
jgi:hypothetical protein